MSYLKVTKNNTNYRFSLMPANDTTSELFPAVKTVKVSTSNTLSFGNINYVSGRTYYVTVKFRTRGDGDSTSSKCSSVGFIANRSDWNNSYGYIHGSATAYAERGQIVEWTYEFTASASESRYTALYFIINNIWANGYDNQTIDLFYYKMWDEQGNVYAENGNTSQNIVTKWSDNTAITSEKTLNNTATTENFLWSEIVNPQKMTVDETYTIDFDAKISGDVSSVDVYLYSSDYQTTGFITSRNIGKPPTTDYGHYSHTFTFSKRNSSSTLPGLRIRFDNNGVTTLGNSGTLYIKNVRLRMGTLEKPYFLKSKKGNEILYDKLYSGGQIKLTKGNVYYLRQAMTLFNYLELTGYTYKSLINNFHY